MESFDFCYLDQYKNQNADLCKKALDNIFNVFDQRK
jgi:hypothetical protein